MPAWRRGTTYLARAQRAIDGDTIEVIWLEPNAAGLFPTRIRLARIDAPELRPRVEPGALAAQAALARLVVGQVVQVTPRRAWPDPYGRIIADVHVAGGDVALIMVMGGFVRPYSATLRRQARIRTQGLNPVSAKPQRRLITPPARTNGWPVSMPSSRTGTLRTTGTNPNQV